MDLAKAPIGAVAALIANGTRQLGEVPSARRGIVEKEANKITAGWKEETVKEDEPEPIVVEPPKDLTKLNVAQLRALAAEYPSIKMESKMKKVELIAALEAARAEVIDAT